MTHLRATILTILASSTFAITACEKNQPEPTQKDPTIESSPAPEAGAAKADPAAATRASLDSYESIRASLAKDDIASGVSKAASLETSARTLAAGDPGAAKEWAAVADAAKSLQSQPKTDADAVRESFGAVSKSLLTLLSGDATLAKGLHVFECPMAQGYKKWVQPSADIENPYMGTKMLECGSESSL